MEILFSCANDKGSPPNGIHLPLVSGMGITRMWVGDGLGAPDVLLGHAGQKAGLSHTARREFLYNAPNSRLARPLRLAARML
jgi:hypothetical protein